LTNKFGEVWPEIAMVIDDGHPDYVIVNWGDEWGVVVGGRQYRLSFDPIGSIAVAPGIYTYYGEHSEVGWKRSVNGIGKSI
jgi:hypothetical protein